MLTKKGKYGLKAMIHLAGQDNKRLICVNDIAREQKIPRKFLDNILADLRIAGLVFSRKGKGGGFALSRDSQTISVGEIIRALDGPLAPIGCASKSRYRSCEDCDIDHCEVRLVMSDVRDAIASVLDQKTLADAAHAE
ncbi:RrF2 family transcriptional regulator [Bartonella sp. LJL80]